MIAQILSALLGFVFVCIVPLNELFLIKFLASPTGCFPLQGSTVILTASVCVFLFLNVT